MEALNKQTAAVCFNSIMHPAPGNVFCHCISESLIMATGSHVESNAEVHRLKQAQPHDLLKRMVCSGDEKNMREVSKRHQCLKINNFFVVYVLDGIYRGLF